ncbi:extracellular solute-binding protein [Bacillus sp. 3255]|uniref:extracellular solute-binding protein n=1 Tax=Bacillus sp. 3255 TaxID=2817904 RepID=UPI002854BC26|nr:extracellular solute-binding protein [Bacillus sp. 3255]MDR6882427.1 putative aldouronate transport system substrate-binding protein [Bacillus sp. 3255]
MEQKNRAVTGIIAGVISVGMLVGCSGVKEGSKPSVPDTVPDTSGKPVTVSWYQTNFAGAELKTMGEAEGFREISHKTGVSLDWQHPATPDQLNVMLASGSYPGVIFWNISAIPKGLRGLVDDGVAIKLNDLIDKYAPNYKKVLEKYPEIRKYTMLDDGTIAAFYQIDPDPKRLAYNGFMLRKDWLEKLGMKAPSTIEEWHTVLKAFKEKDPNGNGKVDEIPYILPKVSGASPLGGGSAGLTEFASAWGILDGFYKDPATGKLVYGALQPQFKDFLTTMSAWYKEGLIDSEYASTDQKGRDTKLQSNLAGATYGLIGSGMGNNIKTARANTPGFSLVGAEMPIGPAGKSYYVSQEMLQKTGWSAVITTNNKNPIETVKMIDYMYSEEGNTLLNWGIEGKSYTVKDGKKQFTPEILNNPQGKAPIQAIAHYAFPINGFTKVMDFEAYKQINLSLPEQQEAADKWAKADTSLLTPTDLSFSPEESAKLSSIMNDINTYKNEMILKFIMGVEPVSKYDEFNQKIRVMGIEKAQKIYQDALDRFNSRK